MGLYFNKENMEERVLYAAICGEPNVGKSTLLNQLLGQKLSIVTPKVQTTRSVLRGIMLYKTASYHSQIILFDTPGIFPARPGQKLERAIVKNAWQGVKEADYCLVIIDASQAISENTKGLLRSLQNKEKEVSIIINKIDLVKNIDSLKAEIASYSIFEKQFYISALKGKGTGELLEFLASKALPAPWPYPEDEISDAPSRYLAAEFTRESLFLHLSEELPYAIAVETEFWQEQEDGSVKIHQVIYVLREGHKNIILGKAGSLIKKIGIKARQEIEQLLGRRVHLFLHVKVRPNWMDNKELLQ